MYASYTDYLQSLKDTGIEDMSFKSDLKYTTILEHVSVEYGKQYLELISSEYSLSYSHITEFARMNDKYGRPKVHSFTYFDKNKGGGGGAGSWVVISASPTSLRYIYHALVILDHYRSSGSDSIVEVGCGYGGLFLAICYFSKILGVKIGGGYTMIDLPGITDLIRKYVSVHNLLTFGVSYTILDTSSTGNYESIASTGAFFISNYCFTEIDEEYRKQYVAGLFGSGIVKHGFITWQTVFGLPIDLVERYLVGYGGKLFEGIVVDEERPQTACLEFPNYFVRF
jgi:hypothetical protein